MCLYLHIYYLKKVAPRFVARPNRGSQTSRQPWAFKKNIHIFACIEIWISLSVYMCLYLHIYYLNRVAPPFAARPNLGSRPSCQPLALKKYIRLYGNMDLSLYICVCICIYII